MTSGLNYMDIQIDMEEIIKKLLASGKITTERYKALLEEYHISPPEAIGSDPAPHYHSIEQDEEKPILKVSKDLSLFDSFLVYKGTRHSYSTITSLSYGRSATKINVIFTNGDNSSFIISMENGPPILLFTMNTFRRGKQAKLLEQAYAFLQPITFQSRLNRIAHELAKKRSTLISTDPKVMLFPNGDVEAEDGIRINLKDAKRNNELSIGAYYRGSWIPWSQTAPNDIVIRERNGSGARSIIFTLQGNEDVWKALINWLAEPGNVL